MSNAKKKYRVNNWKEYNKALIKRGNITVWFEPETLQQWYHACKNPQRGRQKKYSDICIQVALTLKMLLKLPLRATQGFIVSLLQMLDLKLEAPNYTTLCRRQGKLKIHLKDYSAAQGPIHLVIDSTGLKVFGEGEWKVRQHGYSKRRTWRKLHLGVNADTGEILVGTLTSSDVQDRQVFKGICNNVSKPIKAVYADGAYDSFEHYHYCDKNNIEAKIPPRVDAAIKENAKDKDFYDPRNKVVKQNQALGEKEWKKVTGYHKRSLAETAMSRFKRLMSDKLDAILFTHQATEAFIKCDIMNKMTSLGMPSSYCIA